MYLLLLIVAFLYSICLSAQTIGGNSVFNFLKLSNTPQLSALGGVNVSHISDDVGLAFNNPALLTSSMHSQINTVFNDFYGRINVYHLAFGYHHEKLKTNFLWGVNYFNYGNVQETDASGNILGRFRPTDWVMQVSASRSYLNRWTYGGSFKFINSSYGIYRSNGIAVNIGILYKDSLGSFTASVLAKNMGFQLKRYDGTTPDDLPFDLQAGISKKLVGSPFSFSLTAQRLHQFDIVYNDTLFNNSNGFNNSRDKKFSFDQIFRHLVLGSQISVGSYIEIYAGYNFLRRKELNFGNAGNGLNGFSIGAGALFGKLQVRYARAYYQSNTAYNQFGINMKLNQYFGLGKFGEKIGW